MTYTRHLQFKLGSSVYIVHLQCTETIIRGGTRNFEGGGGRDQVPEKAGPEEDGGGGGKHPPLLIIKPGLVKHGSGFLCTHVHYT